jgi:hypothetical protein
MFGILNTPTERNSTYPYRHEDPAPAGAPHGGERPRFGRYWDKVRLGGALCQGGERNMAAVKKIVTWVIILFIGYTILMYPGKSADFVHGVFAGVASGADMLTSFFDRLVT